MGVFQSVANWVLGEYKVRTTQATDGAQLQHVRLDVGAGTTESQVTAANPLPTNLAQVGGASIALGAAPVGSSLPVVNARGTSPDGLVQSEDVTTTGVYSPGAGQWTAWTGQVSLATTFLSASAPASISVGSGAAATLAISNSTRRKFIINNLTSVFLFVKFGSGASSTDYSLFMLPNTFYESFIGDYAGIITARTNSGTVNILVQEFT